jgi:hypothetical protein
MGIPAGGPPELPSAGEADRPGNPLSAAMTRVNSVGAEVFYVAARGLLEVISALSEGKLLATVLIQGLGLVDHATCGVAESGRVDQRLARPAS